MDDISYRSHPRGRPGKIGKSDVLRLAAAADLCGQDGDRLLSERDPFELMLLIARVEAGTELMIERDQRLAQEVILHLAEALGSKVRR
jgi:hypothetical protein